jgi:hypothetical protein
MAAGREGGLFNDIMRLLDKKSLKLVLLGLIALIFLAWPAAPSQAATNLTACTNHSTFFLTLKSFSGLAASGLKFELYEQRKDSHGLPIAGQKIGGGSVDSAGQAYLSFKPDSGKVYAIKVWDKRSDLGEFWFFDAIRFVCNYDRYVTKYLPLSKIVLRDSQGKLKRNYDFAVYAQRYDADGQPFFESRDLIANLKTNGGGQASLYISPYNPYQWNQSGFYVISSKDASSISSTIYNLQIPSDRDYTFQYVFSSLSGELRDANRKLQANREIRLYEQIKVDGVWALGRQLIKVNTNASGRFQLDFPAGTYALAVLDDFNQENIFWNTSVQSRTNNSKKITPSAVKFSLADTLGENIPRNASLKIYALESDGGREYYRDRQVGDLKLSASKTAYASLAPGYYLAVYTGRGNKEYGRYFQAINGRITTVNLVLSTKSRIGAEQVFQINN